MKHFIKRTFLSMTAHTYSNMSRLFIRLFVGVMLLQFGIKQAVGFDTLCDSFPSVLGMSSELTLMVMIVIEIFCSLNIMLGFLTRLNVIPPMVAMIIAEFELFSETIINPSLPSYVQVGYLPIMFIGIYLYLILAGPGKVSIDYFMTLKTHSYRLSRSMQEEIENT